MGIAIRLRDAFTWRGEGKSWGAELLTPWLRLASLRGIMRLQIADDLLSGIGWDRRTELLDHFLNGRFPRLLLARRLHGNIDDAVTQTTVPEDKITSFTRSEF
jgi:hypothetical protein